MIDKKERLNAVYTAHSKYNFFARRMISAFVLEQNKIPLNPFTNWDYFMNDMVDRSLTIRANNNLIYLSDELWQFGTIADGCYWEIKLAMEQNMEIKFYTIGKKLSDIKELSIDELDFEDELKEEVDINAFIEELKEYNEKRNINDRYKTYKRK